MSAPTVACVMLANGRQEMARRAMRSWHAQTYEGQKRLVVYNNSGDQSIGRLRNIANAIASEDVKSKPDIICHWDTDDWSHPNRIAEQVALLQSSGAKCVGYNEMLFWQSSNIFSSAWLYRAAIPNYAIGTSMCYWRSTWERNPFPDRSEGCDDLDWFNRGVKIDSASSFQNDDGVLKEPRMIASIHGGNTCAKISPAQREWKRLPAADGYCREMMKL